MSHLHCPPRMSCRLRVTRDCDQLYGRFHFRDSFSCPVQRVSAMLHNWAAFQHWNYFSSCTTNWGIDLSLCVLISVSCSWSICCPFWVVSDITERNGLSNGLVIDSWCRTHLTSFDERNLRLSWQQNTLTPIEMTTMKIKITKTPINTTTFSTVKPKLFRD